MSNIEIKNLHFSYGDGEEILKGINFNIDERSTAIIGQNGAGKTTFAKLLKGILKPTKGSIILDGEDLKNKKVSNLAKDIGMVFQNPNDQIFKYNVLDEVMFGPLKIGMKKDEARKRSIEALEKVGLVNIENTNPYDYGLSIRKLIAIASIIAMDTKVIIFDEPTIAQDYAGKEKIRDIILDLKSQGKTVITITHDMNFVAEIFERAVVFANGILLDEGNIRDIFSKRELLEKAYLEQPDVTKLCHMLGYNETFVTIDEFINNQKYIQVK